jgi:hypothetical protein
MCEMHDRFEARLRQVHKQQRQYDKSVKELKAYFEANPRRTAQALLLSLPRSWTCGGSTLYLVSE